MFISETFGLEDYKTRKAEVHQQIYDGFYYVKFFDNDEYVRTQVLKGKSVHYAEDAAENWCCGIIKK